MKLRELDPRFGYPTDRGIPFLRLLAVLGNDDAPKPFIELLEEEYQKKQIKFDGFSWLRRSLGGSYETYLRQLASCVDFCLTFVT